MTRFFALTTIISFDTFDNDSSSAIVALKKVLFRTTELLNSVLINYTANTALRIYYWRLEVAYMNYKFRLQISA